MEYTTANEQMIFCLFKPFEQIDYQFRNSIGRRRHMDQSFLREYTNATTSESACIIGKRHHHRTMCF